MLAAEFGTGEVLWSIFWFFLFIIWFFLLISVFSDIIRSDDLSGGAKALWAVLVIFLPYLGIFLYLIVRGGKMGERSMEQAKAQDEAMQTYIRNAAGGSGAGDQLAKLSELHASGKLSDDEYAKAKAKVIA